MNKRAVIGAICAISTLFAFNGSASTFADEGVGFSIDVSEATLQLTAPETATIELNPISSAAVFNSTNFNINVATNNMTGYTLTMSVATTDLTHNTLTNTVIPTLTAASTEANFPANAWGYKVVGDEYQPILTSNAPISWITDEPTNGNNHSLTIAAKVDGSTPSGTYETTLTFQAVSNPNALRDTITFDKNNNDATGTMPSQVIFQDTPTALIKNAFQHPTLRFAGWSTTSSGTGEGVRYYADEGLYTGDATNEGRTITLYAQWTSLPELTEEQSSGNGPRESSPTGTTFARAYEIAYTSQHKGMYEKDESDGGDGKYHLINSWAPDNEPYHGYDVRFAMQDMTPEICASVTEMHDDYRALDIRDNKLYHITKLADGNCWMTQNLDLELVHTESDSDALYTHDNTDLGWTTFDSNAKWNPTRSTVATTNGFDEPYGVNSLDRNNYIYYDSSSRIYNTETDFRKYHTLPDGVYSHYLSGNYYSFSAAVATNNTSSGEYVNQYYNAPNSICPSNWRLPRGLQNGYNDATSASEYAILLYKEGVASAIATTLNQRIDLAENGGVKFQSSPLYFVVGGVVAQSSYGLSQVGSQVRYQTCTVGHKGSNNSIWWYSNNLHFSHGYYGAAPLVPTNDSGRFEGSSVRCLAR